MGNRLIGKENIDIQVYCRYCKRDYIVFNARINHRIIQQFRYSKANSGFPAFGYGITFECYFCNTKHIGKNGLQIIKRFKPRYDKYDNKCSTEIKSLKEKYI